MRLNCFELEILYKVWLRSFQSFLQQGENSKYLSEEITKVVMDLLATTNGYSVSLVGIIVWTATVVQTNITLLPINQNFKYIITVIVILCKQYTIHF